MSLLLKKKRKKKYTVGTAPKFSLKIVERDKIDTNITHIYDCSLFLLGPGTSIKSGWVSEISTLAYNQINSV